MPAPFNLVKTFDGGLSRLYMFFSIQLQRLHFFLGVSERTVERYISKFLVTGDVKVSVNENFSTLLDFVFFGFLA